MLHIQRETRRAHREISRVGGITLGDECLYPPPPAAYPVPFVYNLYLPPASLQYPKSNEMPVHVSVGAKTVRHGTFIPFGVFRQAFCPVALAVCVYVMVRGFHATRPIAAHSLIHHIHELVLITRESAHYVLVLQPHYGRAIGLEEKRRVHRPAYVKIVIGQQEMFGQSRYAVQIQLYGCGVEQRQVPGIYNLTVVYNPNTGIGRIKPLRSSTERSEYFSSSFCTYRHLPLNSSLCAKSSPA